MIRKDTTDQMEWFPVAMQQTVLQSKFYKWACGIAPKAWGRQNIYQLLIPSQHPLDHIVKIYSNIGNDYNCMYDKR